MTPNIFEIIWYGAKEGINRRLTGLWDIER